MQVRLPSKSPGLPVPRRALGSLCETGTASSGLGSSTQVTRFRYFHCSITVPLFKHCKFFGLINTGGQLDYVNLVVCSRQGRWMLTGFGGHLLLPRTPPAKAGTAFPVSPGKRTRHQPGTSCGHSLPAAVSPEPALGTALINTPCSPAGCALPCLRHRDGREGGGEANPRGPFWKVLGPGCDGRWDSGAAPAPGTLRLPARAMQTLCTCPRAALTSRAPKGRLAGDSVNPALVYSRSWFCWDESFEHTSNP